MYQAIHSVGQRAFKLETASAPNSMDSTKDSPEQTTARPFKWVAFHILPNQIELIISHILNNGLAFSFSVYKSYPTIQVR
jgi:hypothetical protein